MKTAAILLLFGVCGFSAPVLRAADAAGVMAGNASALETASAPQGALSNTPVASPNLSTVRSERGNRRVQATVRNPVPILPALPAPNDTSFYASNAVPHGSVEIVRYKTTAGVEKRLHIYLPPDYGTEN